MFNAEAFVLAFAIAMIAGFALQIFRDYKEVTARDEEER